jgi:hypothetical protein
MTIQNPWNVVDNHLTRIQSGLIIGAILMLQMMLFLYTGTLAHHHILGTISALAGIVGAMFVCLGIIVKVFIYDYEDKSK